MKAEKAGQGIPHAVKFGSFNGKPKATASEFTCHAVAFGLPLNGAAEPQPKWDGLAIRPTKMRTGKQEIAN